MVIGPAGVSFYDPPGEVAMTLSLALDGAETIASRTWFSAPAGLSNIPLET